MTVTPISAEILRGAAELEPTADGVVPHRLPAWAREQSGDGQLLMAESQPSGVRVTFRSAATVVELETRPTMVVYVGTPPRPDGVYDLVIDGVLVDRGSVAAGNVLAIDLTTGTTTTSPGPSGTVRFADLPARSKDIEIWLPHTEATELIELRADAAVSRLRPTAVASGCTTAAPSVTAPSPRAPAPPGRRWRPRPATSR